MKRKRKILSVLLLAVSMLLISAGCGSTDKAQDNQVADTKYGKFVGLTRDSGVVSFLGVPYAKQP